MKTRMSQNLSNEKSHGKGILTETSGRWGGVTPAPVLQAHCSGWDTRVKVVTLVAVVGHLTANGVLVGVKASVANRVRRSTRDRCSDRREEKWWKKIFPVHSRFCFLKEGRSLRFLLFVVPPPRSFIQDGRVTLAPHLNKLSALPERVVKSVWQTLSSTLYFFEEELKLCGKNLHWDNHQLQTPNFPFCLLNPSTYISQHLLCALT